ncbi:hypothetical protein JNK13_03930 [bacterium]|nr:hypothetical protein [bacterium]
MKDLITKPIEIFDEDNIRGRVVYVAKADQHRHSVIGTLVIALISTVLLVLAVAVIARLIKKLLT